jgi:arsenite-transporting ATPase
VLSGLFDALFALFEGESMDPNRGPLYYFFSGKGGVGKTTLAAATGVYLARRGMRVLISSTDPAHSLSDVFDRQIGHKGCVLEPNLQALEVDSTARWAETTSMMGGREAGRGRGRQAGGVGEGAAGSKGGSRAGRWERALGEVVKMAGDAPGVDEFVSLEILLETMESRAFDTVIFDTAPTGHALRLLQLPEMLDGWIGKLLALKGHLSRVGRVLKRIMPGAGSTGEGEPVDLSTGLTTVQGRISEARRLLTDEERTLFALVTIPEAMSVLETTRTIQQLGDHSIPLGVVIVNQVQPHSESCPHCRARRAIHEKELVALEETCTDVPLRLVESKPRVIRGNDELAELGEELWEKGGDGPRETTS